jgi:hypothetical protein
MGYRILTYTSKNEFYVIDVSKAENQIRKSVTKSSINQTSSARILGVSDHASSSGKKVESSS